MAEIIFEFYQCLLHQSEQFEKIMTQFSNQSFQSVNSLKKNNCSVYVKKIAQKSDIIIDQFSERHLFKLVENSDAKNLLKNEIIENKNILFSIVTRDTEQVIRDIIPGKKSLPQPETEPIFQTQFNCFPNNLYKVGVKIGSAKCGQHFEDPVPRRTVLIENPTLYDEN